MLEGLIGREAAQELSRLGKRAAEVLRGLSEKGEQAGKKGLLQLEEAAKAAIQDRHAPVDPAARKVGTVPATDLFDFASAQEVTVGQMQQRVVERYRGRSKVEDLSLVATKMVQWAEQHMEAARATAIATLQDGAQFKGTSVPVADVLQKVQVRLAENMAMAGRARFVTPRGTPIAPELMHKRFPSQELLYQAIMKGEVIPQVLVNGAAFGHRDAPRHLPWLVTREMTHLLSPTPYLGEGLKEGLAELTTVTLRRKQTPRAVAEGYELEVAGAQILAQIYKAAFAGGKDSLETILGHLTTSRRVADILSSRLKLDPAEEEILQAALQASDSRVVLLSLLALSERLARQKKMPRLDLPVLLNDLLGPDAILRVKSKLAGH